ncbi:MAG: DUF2442 domain-containing protein [Bacteroidales bacterium]|nr:DUF2442 domain-containing protein [Bacteroidales bacterium]
MKITEIWFKDGYIYGKTDNGDVLRQSMRFYPRLRHATEDERNNYRFSTAGIHWRNIDEDVSFESFLYDEHEPALMYVG